MAEKDGGGGRYLYEQYSTPLSTNTTSCSGGSSTTTCGSGSIATIGAKPQNNGLGSAAATLMPASAATMLSMGAGSGGGGSLNNVVESPTALLKAHAHGKSIGGSDNATTGAAGAAAADPNGGGGQHRRRSCCSACTSPAAVSFWVGLLANLGICTLLLAYTLLGECFFCWFLGVGGLRQFMLKFVRTCGATSTGPCVHYILNEVNEVVYSAPLCMCVCSCVYVPAVVVVGGVAVVVVDVVLVYSHRACLCIRKYQKPSVHVPEYTEQHKNTQNKPQQKNTICKFCKHGPRLREP